MKNNIYFVSGIDTDTGKSYATGFIAKLWSEQGKKIITQKLVQTGNTGYSEDIEIHRRIMGIPFTEEDKKKITMPEIYTYPASPHLAARIDNRPVNFTGIEQATTLLSNKYDKVLLEGAGGLMVPLTNDILTVDYIAEKEYPVILVTSGKLGSINHTLLSLELIRHRGLKLAMVAYNLFPSIEDETIKKDTEHFLRARLDQYFPGTEFLQIPIIKMNGL